VLRWGRFTRFVSVSVLTGFLTGVAANIILGQLGHLLGSPQKGSPALVKAFNVVMHPGAMSLTAAAVGLAALALMVILTRTRIASVASLVGLAVSGLTFGLVQSHGRAGYSPTGDHRLGEAHHLERSRHPL
jgi:sulfate permease, SulP family